jgi:hypothetical protein
MSDIVGRFNSGKTFFLRLLTGLESLGDAGETQRTSGIAFKLCKFGHASSPIDGLVMDTEGYQAPANCKSMARLRIMSEH